MSGVKHTPVRGVHPDNTAWSAVDACGGTYTPAEEASGWADGHRAALASAIVAVGRVDRITADLLVALTAICSALEDGDDCDAALIAKNAGRAAIARARGEQDGGGG